MTSGLWDIPVPANTKTVDPTVLFVPLVGFDAAGYRLGYGEGFYDKILASLSSLPIAIGVGYESGRLASICPQHHDIPMDAIVTEYQFKWRDASCARMVAASRRNRRAAGPIR
jgi:5-formyltetrahydrofolate cyclo-ligase